MKGTFTIGKFAMISGVNRQTLRYYDKLDLLAPCGRNTSGYRIYDESAFRRLNFIRWAKELGFTLVEIKEILPQWDCGKLTCNHLRSLVSAKLHIVESKVSELNMIQERLLTLFSSCEGQGAEECPIINKMRSQKCASR